ncbi:tyrosine-type recombinase/integrase [Caulobacter segnis]|uniref:tyrosine-type recombinase/integrase n=1 Tax=Caulobacter segnis TaxID=88688 RepID=UPI001CBB0D93|nr:site-specific integrase [Caulobacter segnis]UAL08920.1 integrase arm-type DNA-binding domain-containing protein [Caulobacter segnis]
MARVYERLTAMTVRQLRGAGRYPDGGGLYLQITPTGARSWIFRYRVAGRERQMGLGPLEFVSLAEAREKARAARLQRYNGEDPLGARIGRRPKVTSDRPASVTFKEAMVAYIETNKVAWRNEKHVQQWSSTLETYAVPHFGRKLLADIDTADVLSALKPIWLTKSETASRLRGRIETVLSWGAAQGYRQGDNPARWKGHIEMILPAKSKVTQVKHHAALDYREVPSFMAKMRLQSGVGVLALRFVILTAARTGEVIGADWSEVDFENRVWTVPASRMKAGREHSVPLSRPAMEILEHQRAVWLEVEARRHRKTLKAGEEGPLGPVFWGKLPGKGLSNMSLLAVLRRMGRDDLTSHGFRSSFRDWAAEETEFPGEVVEMALAHTIANRVEAAYRRGDLLEKRRALMTKWAETVS